MQLKQHCRTIGYLLFIITAWEVLRVVLLMCCEAPSDWSSTSLTSTTTPSLMPSASRVPAAVPKTFSDYQTVIWAALLVMVTWNCHILIAIPTTTFRLEPVCRPVSACHQWTYCHAGWHGCMYKMDWRLHLTFLTMDTLTCFRYVIQNQLLWYLSTLIM